GDYEQRLRSVSGLEKLVRDHHPAADSDLQLLLMEFALHGLAEYSLIGRTPLTSGLRFKDLISGMFNPSKLDDLAPDDDEEEDDDDNGGGGRKGGRR
ncbi:MAG: magnesium chelatase, partial [Bacteroidota bacterium]